MFFFSLVQQAAVETYGLRSEAPLFRSAEQEKRLRQLQCEKSAPTPDYGGHHAVEYQRLNASLWYSINRLR